METLDYIFFHEKPLTLFLAFLEKQGLQAECENDEDCYQVSLPDTIEEALSEKIESEYEKLFAMNQQLVEDSQNENAAGVVVNLKDGSTTYADIDPALLSRIMQVLTPQEMGDVVNAIVDAIEDPDRRALCQRVRDKQGDD